MLVRIHVTCIHRQVAPKAAAVIGEDGIPKPTKGTTADEWVPRGKTAPKGKPKEVVLTKGEGDDVSGMDVDDEEEGGDQEEGEGNEEGGEEAEEEDEDEEEAEEEEPAPLALVSVMMHRNGCKLLLRLLAPERTGYATFTHLTIMTAPPPLYPPPPDGHLDRLNVLFLGVPQPCVALHTVGVFLWRWVATHPSLRVGVVRALLQPTALVCACLPLRMLP